MSKSSRISSAAGAKKIGLVQPHQYYFLGNRW